MPERNASYFEMQQEKIGGVVGGEDGWRKAYFPLCEHSTKYPEFVLEHHSGCLLTIQQIAAFKWPQTFTFAPWKSRSKKRMGRVGSNFSLAC